MSKTVKRWLLWGSLAILLLSVVSVTYTSNLPYNERTDFLNFISVAVLIACFLNLIFIPAFIYRDRAGFRKWMRLLTFCLPVLIVILFILEARWFPIVPDAIYGTYLFLVIIFIGLGCLYMFVIDDRKSVAGIILILSYIILTLILRRSDASLYESHFLFSFLMISCGMYLFGLKALFIIEKNSYLQIISFIACLLIYFGYIIMFNYSMTSRSSTYLIIYSILLFLLTLTVLLSLPVSGYIEWSASQKVIFKKILIPWIFFLLLFSIRFVFPDLNYLFFRPAREETQEFILNDYTVTNRNGLEPD